MTLPTEVRPLLRSTAAAAGGYTINNSLRFRSSASAYLTRNFGASTSGSKTWTWSGWVKRGTLGTDQQLFGNFTTISQNFGGLQFTAANAISFVNYTSSIQNQITTTAVYRDPSSWYHIVLIFDSTQATASNRIKLYVNGVQVTSFSAATYPVLNDTSFWNNSAYNPMLQGALVFNNSLVNYFDGYMAEVNFVDGQALAAANFGAFDTTTGVWQPKAYTGTYGNNGFYLKFSSFGTAAALGTDSSGNGNTWTVNNISVTAGTTYDPMLDSPTLTSATVANFAVLNPVGTPYSANLSSANLNFSNSTLSSYPSVGGSIYVTSGKWYYEATPVSATTLAMTVGFTKYPQFVTGSGNAGAYQIQAGSVGYSNDGTITVSGTTVATVSTFAVGDIIGIALNLDAGTAQFYKNNTVQSYTVTSLSGQYVPAFCLAYYSSQTMAANFGQRPFSYTPPTGYVALNAYNLATPTIANGLTGMGVTLYTGNGGNTNSIPHGLPFTPNLVWQKSRVAASFGGNNHQIYDSVRGFGSGKELASNSTASEGNTGGATYGILSSVDSTYLNAALGTSGSQTWNQSGITYVVWNWLAGASSGSNTNGSITSTVSVNATAGFSIVTFTGTGANATVGHGLGVAPSMVLIKNRNNVGGSTAGFAVGHVSLPWPNGYLQLWNTNSAGSAASVWNTSPTSTVVGLGTDLATNYSGAAYVAYCWSAVAGYSAFGSYTGNGSTDGPFVYTGFRPRFVMVKRTDSTGNWQMLDTSRLGYNSSNYSLFANLTNAEAYNVVTDILSNGLKIRDTSTDVNASSGTYIYAAFAENPFRYSLAR